MTKSTNWIYIEIPWPGYPRFNSSDPWEIFGDWLKENVGKFKTTWNWRCSPTSIEKLRIYFKREQDLVLFTLKFL